MRSFRLGREYKISFETSDNSPIREALSSLPDPTVAGSEWDAYSAQLEDGGIYFLDNLHGDSDAASIAFWLLIQAVLRCAEKVIVEEL